MDAVNPLLKIAEDFIQYTDCPVFLSGKAGTGKTTFLKHIKNKTHKTCAVVAPTGVAAINAGGMTIHSFLQLPFAPFIPATNAFNNTSAATDKHQLLGKIKYSKDRIQMMQQLELLIIDEISMVRCDLLDEIDIVLRHTRKKEDLPFGGVQVLLIGDLMQLAPVARKEEWEILSLYYDSPYFFSSRVWKMQRTMHIELQTVYRQKNPVFIDILNRVRNNDLDEMSIQLLQETYQPFFEPPKYENYITLTTHNKTADALNEKALKKIGSLGHHFTATIEGEFYENNYPVDHNLVLKKSAQVMFLKNDTSVSKKYFNGKIGIIDEISEDKITVKCDDEIIPVKKEKWDNVRYRLNAATQQMEEEVIGSFTQFPLRLAWAITIHKSQGLTFEKAMIDPGAAFAPGQVYVALSRCTSLDGLVLLSPINFRGLGTDPMVRAFLSEVDSKEDLVETLQHKTRENERALVTGLFSFTHIVRDGTSFVDWLLGNNIASNSLMKDWTKSLEQKIQYLDKIFQQFQQELQGYVKEEIPVVKQLPLQQRMKAAANYFNNEFEQLLSLLEQSPVQTDNKIIAQKYQNDVDHLYEEIFRMKYLLQSCGGNFSTEIYFILKKNYRPPIFKGNAKSTTIKKHVDSPHPHLYEGLIRLRNKLAAEKNLPVYRVAGFKTIDEMISFLPQSKEALQRISGFGKIKADQFGDHFIKVIIDYCKENNLEAPEMDLPVKKKKKEKAAPKPHSREESLALYKKGMSVQQIAIQRNFAIETIQGHLAYFVGKGQIAVSDLLSPEKLKTIEAVYRQMPGQNMGLLKTKLGTAASYGDINIALAYLREKNETE